MSRLPTRDPELWRRLWLEAKERSPVNRRKGPGAPADIQRWNLRAPSYAAHSDSRDILCFNVFLFSHYATL